MFGEVFCPSRTTIGDNLLKYDAAIEVGIIVVWVDVLRQSSVEQLSIEDAALLYEMAYAEVVVALKELNV